jgi:hypothetical protein
MSATVAERLIDGKRICAERAEKNDICIFDQIVEVASPDDSMAFIVIDSVMTLLLYLAPVSVFGYLVAPIVARLLSMPVSN